jgi:hypothetical protein
MSKQAWVAVLKTSEANPTPTQGQAPVEFKTAYPMQPDASFYSKLFERKTGLFSPDHEQVASGLDFERKRLVMEEYPCFLQFPT